MKKNMCNVNKTSVGTVIANISLDEKIRGQLEGIPEDVIQAYFDFQIGHSCDLFASCIEELIQVKEKMEV